ncbi:MAG TPA: ATP-binding protein, partial [Labilithrix sp.]|nr:ATP-binding protein [Labilithrix sp.]
DQYKRDIPYSTFAQAFAGLIEQVLTESEERVAEWKKELERALGVSGQLVVDVIPQLEHIIGPQPALVSLPPAEAQNRFLMVFRQFVGVFARKEHPLALFLDDLQWLDSDSLKLIEQLVLHPQTRYLLLLGAYRDNEVGSSHPLRLLLDKLRSTDAVVRKIVLGPLDVEHVGQLITASLRCSARRAAPLARLVHQKTAGNPFFAIQFLTTLYQDGLLAFERSTSEWQWKIAKIHAKGFTDNVLDLMARKLKRLPCVARDALKLAACVGSRADLDTLAVISNQSHEETARRLAEAVAEGLVLQRGDVYAFVHDRVQQGAYALMGEGEKEEAHLEIGRLLLRNLEPRAVDERIFDVVSQLNRGASLMTDASEKDALVRLDLIAARKAKASIAYAPARNFLSVAAALLPSDAWESRYDVVFPVFMERAECAYLCGAFEESEALFELLLARARTAVDKAAVYELRLQLYVISGNNAEALQMGISALKLLGVEIPDDGEEVNRAMHAERDAIKARLGDRKISDLANAAETKDPIGRAIIGVLSHVMPAAYFGNEPDIWWLFLMKLVHYSLQFGHTEDSCFGYASYGASLLEEPHVGYQFSEMAIALNQKLGDTSRRGTVLHVHGDHVNFWVKPYATAFPILESAFLACIDAGDLVFAGCVAFQLPWQAIERGDTISDALAFSRKYATFARDSRIEAVHQTIRLEQQFLSCLAGATRGPTSFDDESFDEKKSVMTLDEAAFTTGIIFYHTMKLVSAYLAGDDALAAHHVTEGKKVLRAAMGMPIETTFCFFDALLLARIHAQKDVAEQRAVLEQLATYEQKLAFWAGNCPENFRAKHALVSAEIARITGDELVAQRRYEDAIRSADANGLVHWQAIANELAGSFYRERGYETIADAYLEKALQCYVRWGAEAKVAQLEARYPQLRRVKSLSRAGTFVGRAEHLDLLSVVKASQSISSVMVQDELLRALLQVVLEEGGARRARLILPRDGEFTIAAEAAVETVDVPPADGGEGLASRVPLSVLLYVQRTGQRIVLDDAAIAGSFGSDPYFARVRPRSAVCLPIRREPEVAALLYLENDLVPGAFTAERLLALELLAAQAAISLENALFLEREHSGRVEAERARERALLLAEATSLVSSTPDYDGVFPALTRLCVRSFADWAGIDLLKDGEVVRLAFAHHDPTMEPLLRELADHYPARLDTAAPQVNVLRSGELTYLPAVTDELIRGSAVDAHHADLVTQVGTRSAIIVPLIARDMRLGALTLAAKSPDRFTPGDVELANELGRRAALAIDNARLLDETRQALKLREEFLLLASHELRTPLMALRLSVESLTELAELGSALPPEMVGRCLRRIVRETDRLQSLSEQVLDVMIIERGELSIRPARIDFSDLLNDIVKRLETELRTASCPVTVTAEPGIVGTWDRSRLEQVITSLLSNAMKFGAGRPIDIRLRELGGIAELVVEDHGIGIEEAKLPRVFDRFERGVPTKHYGGFGLGLYITRSLVEAHGGRIRAASKMGVGSTFTVELPLARVEQTAHREVTPASPSVAPRQRRGVRVRRGPPASRGRPTA